MIESTMIRLRKRDDKLASSLIASINTHTRFPQGLWAHERDQLEQKIRLSLKQVRSLFLDCGFKLLCVIAWNPVPGFCVSPMH